MINILEMIEDSALKYGTANAFVDEKTALSYATVIDRAKRMGSSLAEMGSRNKAIAVLLPKCVSALVCFMGIIYSGNFYVPIDADMPVDRMKIILDAIQPVQIIASEETLELDLQEYNKNKVLYEDLVHGKINGILLETIRDTAIDTDPVYALFTSGSTGVPKGVIVCHRSVINYSQWCVKTFGFSHETVFGNQTPFYFSMSVLDIYSTIASGGCLVIVPSLFFSFPADLVEFLNTHKVNALYWAPSALCIVAKSNIFEVKKLKYINKVLFAGEVMPTRQLNVWRKYLPNALYANLFGPTEITDIGIFYILNRNFEDNETIPIGNPCQNVGIFVLGENKNLVLQPGQVGELYFRGSYLAHGYYRNWEKTKEVFVQNPLNNEYPEIVYKTGDLVRWNAKGELEYVSRKDFQIKHMGYRIEIGEIETAADSVPGIDKACVVYDDVQKKIVLHCTIANEEMNEKKIYSGLKKKLPKYMLPNVIKIHEMLPLNSNGKIDRIELKRRLEN